MASNGSVATTTGSTRNKQIVVAISAIVAIGGAIAYTIARYRHDQSSAGREEKKRALAAARREKASSTIAATANAVQQLETLFGTAPLVSKDPALATTGVPARSLAGDGLIAIYFSAAWCPPCQKFTPKLAAMWTAVRAAGKKFQVVYASSDEKATQFNTYFGKMPWLAIPFDANGRQVVESLSEQFQVKGIPRLVVINGHGKVVNDDARGDVEVMGNGAYDHWVDMAQA